MRRKCKCIKWERGKPFNVGYYYYYNISEINENTMIMKKLYPVNVFCGKNDDYSATFSVKFFKSHFIDIQENRKQKINKINEI